MLPLPGRDEACALRLEDLASALDAGLDPHELFPAHARGTSEAAAEGLVGALAGEGLRLSESETTVLELAESAGSLPKAMRRLAAARRLRGELLSELAKSLLYPAFLLAFGLGAFGLMEVIAGRSGLAVVTPVLVVASVFALSAFALRTLLRNPSFKGAKIPGLAGLLGDLGEVPYLATMHALYGGGMALQTAHPLALRAVWLASVRARLFAADRTLQAGRPLTEALAGTAALCPETLRILATAEAAGELEDALARALERRRVTLRRRAARAALLLRVLISGLVVLFVAWHIIGFYLDAFAGLDRIR